MVVSVLQYCEDEKTNGHRISVKRSNRRAAVACGVSISVGFPSLIVIQDYSQVSSDTQTVHIDSKTNVTCHGGEERERQETREHARSLQGQRFVTWRGAGNTKYKCKK